MCEKCVKLTQKMVGELQKAGLEAVEVPNFQAHVTHAQWLEDWHAIKVTSPIQAQSNLRPQLLMRQLSSNRLYWGQSNNFSDPEINFSLGLLKDDEEKETFHKCFFFAPFMAVMFEVGFLQRRHLLDDDGMEVLEQKWKDGCERTLS